MSSKTISYTAHKSLQAFHASNEYLRIIIGPTKSGNTTAALVEVFSRAREQLPDDNNVRCSRWAVVGASTSAMRADQIPVWLELAPESAFGPMDGTTHRIKYELGDNTTVDAEVIFAGASSEGEATRLGSYQLTGAVLTGEGIHDAALDNLRATIGLYPRRPTYCGIVIESIYPEPDTWLDKLLHRPPPGTEIFQRPAGDSPDAENLNALPVGYYQRLIETNRPDWVARYVRATLPPGHRIMSELELVHRLSHVDREVKERGLSHAEAIRAYPVLALLNQLVEAGA